MGVLTTIYQAPVSIMDQVIANPELIDQLYYPEYHSEGDATPQDVGLSPEWEPKHYGFDKAWEDYLGLYGQVGRRELQRALESEVTEVEHEGGAWIRYWSPEQVQRIAQMMNQFSVDEFHAECSEVETLTDWDGRPYEEFMLGLMTKVHGSFGLFVQGAEAAGDAMIAATE